jgi:hypothetical protein
VKLKKYALLEWNIIQCHLAEKRKNVKKGNVIEKENMEEIKIGRKITGRNKTNGK